MSVVTRVREALSGDTPGAESQSDAPRATRLYHCASCGTTYVSDEMESCSRCDTVVETVPTEQDLGLL